MTTGRVDTPWAARSGTEPWRHVVDALGTEIRDQAFAEAGRLPGENELAERFGVSRHTLRQALAVLRRQGLVRSEPGRGHYVRQAWLEYGLSRRTRFGDNLRRQGLAPSMQLLTRREVEASEHVADALQLHAGARVLRVEMLDEADGQAVGLATAWYPADRFAGLLEKLTAGTRTSEALQEFGVQDYWRAESRVSTRMPSDTAARLLGQPTTRPLLCIQSIDVDAAGQPIKYGETLFCGDRVRLHVAEAEDR